VNHSGGPHRGNAQTRTFSPASPRRTFRLTRPLVEAPEGRIVLSQAVRTLGDFLVETGDIAITKYGLVENKKTKLWTGAIKLTNTGDATISGPIYVLFSLPPGAILENAAGTYDGMPYLKLNVSSLAVGASVGVAVVFNTDVNPAAYSTTYHLTAPGS
jgi:hypothetical protein